jgi:thiamine transport system ATP-binding protein
MLRLDDLVIARGGFSLAADFSLPAGARCALIGPSGAGKSSLLGAVAGFVAPRRGRVLWSGSDITPLPPAERPVSIIFQDHNLFPHLSVFQNVALGLSPGLRLTGEDRDRVEDTLARVGLAGFGGRRPGTLSGGQQGRVALARILLRSRPVLLLDEAFAALGPAQRGEMLDLVAELLDTSGATLLMVSHNPADALRICPVTVAVGGGRALAPRPTGEVLRDPPPELADYLGP